MNSATGYMAFILDTLEILLNCAETNISWQAQRNTFTRDLELCIQYVLY